MRRRRSSNRNGQALVEFALTVPILLLLIVGIIEFGRLMSAYQTVTDTAREAARRAVVADQQCTNKEDDIADMIRERLEIAGLDPVGWINQESFITCGPPGSPTTVELTYGYHMGWLGPLIGGDERVQLSTETRMRQE